MELTSNSPIMAERPPDEAVHTLTVLRTRPAMPQSQLAAQATLAWWSARTLDAYRAYELAKRELEQCRGELAIVRAVAGGEFDDGATA